MNATDLHAVADLLEAAASAPSVVEEAAAVLRGLADGTATVTASGEMTPATLPNWTPVAPSCGLIVQWGPDADSPYAGAVRTLLAPS